MIAKVPVIPMYRILAQYVKANNLPLRINRLEEFIRAYHHYCKHVNKLN